MEINRWYIKIMQTVGIAVALVFLGSLQGCKYYFKVQTIKKVAPQEVKIFDSVNKYFIVHLRDSAWHLSNPILTGNTLSGELTALPENRYKFLTTKPIGSNRYLKNEEIDESYVLEEVHLYLTDSLWREKHTTGNIQIAFSSIQNTEIYIKDKGKTTVSWLLPPIIVALSAGAVTGTIMMVSAASSLPNASDWKVK